MLKSSGRAMVTPTYLDLTVMNYQHLERNGDGC